MSEAAELHAPHAEFDDPNTPKHDVTLNATLSGNTVTISGTGDFSIPRGQAATHCKFILNDTSGTNVMFDSLDAADNTTTCPGSGTGNQSGQIVGVTTNNNASPRTAQFTDNNNNVGNLSIAYAWNFTCDGPYTVSRFDPVISNGGKSTPM